MSGVEGSDGAGERVPDSTSDARDAESAADGVPEGMGNEQPNRSLNELEIPPGAAAQPEDAQSGSDEIHRLRAEVRENYDKYLRLAAEVENVKKRAVKERSDLIKYAGESLAKDVVDVLDDIERALNTESVGTLEDFLKGVSLIRDRFTGVLEQHSIKPRSGLGQDFDPLVQQALASVPTSDHPPGKVIQEFKKAYYFKDKLLRPGQVVVSAAPAEAEDSGKDEG